MQPELRFLAAGNESQDFNETTLSCSNHTQESDDVINLVFWFQLL